MSEQFVAVGAIGEIPPGGVKTVMVGRTEVAVFNVAGVFYAIDNTCPHQGAPLSEGWVFEKTVTCPWHAWCFSLETGFLTLGDYEGVSAYDVRVEDGIIAVRDQPRALAR